MPTTKIFASTRAVDHEPRADVAEHATGSHANTEVEGLRVWQPGQLEEVS